jgi:hypothetical protein
MTSSIPSSTDGTSREDTLNALNPNIFASMPLPEKYYSCADEPTSVDLKHGALWIPLTDNQKRPAERFVRDSNQWIEAITEYANNRGFKELHTRWALGELIANAIQYGGTTNTDSHCGLVRVEWEFQDKGDECNLILGVSNPVLKVFDPTRYARMTVVDFFSMEQSPTNAHEGTNTLLAFLKPGTSLNYLWELRDEGRLFLQVRPIPENAPDRPDNYEDLKRPITTDLHRVSNTGEEYPYSFQDFLADTDVDTTRELACHSVQISCTLTNKTS